MGVAYSLRRKNKSLFLYTFFVQKIVINRFTHVGNVYITVYVVVCIRSIYMYTKL